MSARLSAPSPSEFSLHRAAADFLDYALPPAAYHTAVDAGSHASPAAGGKAKARGVRPGFPDHLVIWNGLVIAIEFKTPKGKVSAVQHATHAKLRLNGVQVFVCRSVDDLRAVLLEAGVPLRVRLS